MARQFACPFCQQLLDVRTFALQTDCYAPDLHLHSSHCPNCASVIEYRAMSGVLEVGYTYWAGSMHFEGIARLRLAGFRPVGTDGVLELAGVQIFPRTLGAS